MAGDRDRSQPYRLWPTNRRILVGGSVIGAIIAAIILCFAYAGGFLSPARLTQAGLIDAFQEVNGVFPGFRRNHAKGVPCKNPIGSREGLIAAQRHHGVDGSD